ncbi:MAG: YadA-like family protein, partial [Neisseriaceae bacterium]|nr:YadA-like family protein [Neisseriaceae bacterium]
AAESSAKGYTDTALGSYAKTSDLAPYAKTADVTSQINSAKTAATTALNNAKTDLQGKIDTANSEIGSLKTEKADKSWVTTELAKVSSGGTVDLSDYATKTYAESQANAAQTNAVTDANAYTDSKVSGLAKASDLAPYAKTSDMNTAIDTAKSGAITDANAYTDSKVGGLAKASDLDKKADKTWVTTELAKVSSGGSIDLSDYAQKDYADNAANAAQTAANAYTDSKLGDYATTTAVGTAANQAKTDAVADAKTYTDDAVKDKADRAWVTAEVAKVSSGGAIDLSDYATNTAVSKAQADANAYTDGKLGDYSTTSEMNTAIDTAKTAANAYTDTALGDYSTTADMNKAIDTAKTTAMNAANAYTDSEVAKAVADANAYTDTALTDNATQTWVKEQKFAKEKAVSDLDDRVSKLVVSGGGYEHITVAGESGSFDVANKETAKFVGDGKNITTDASGGEVKISLAKDIEVDSVKVNGSSVALTQNGLNNGGQVISNVAAGVRPTDAVNVAQLNNAVYASEGRLNARIDSVEKRANAGAAQALAAANMPTASQPGEGMLSVSGGSYRGEQGYAIGYSQLSESGRWVFRATGSGNSRGHFGGAVGVGIKLF